MHFRRPSKSSRLRTEDGSPSVRIAIAHDYLTQRGGAEKVVLALHRGFPDAPLYTMLYEPTRTYPEFREVDIRPSGLNRISAFRRFHRPAFPLLAMVANRIRVPAAHTIVSSSGWAHGFTTAGSKIVYCYSPARWLYQTEAYLGPGRSLKRIALNLLGPALRRWDKRKAMTATKYFAISSAVKQRIADAYGIDAEVLPAPHSIDTALPQETVDTSPIGSPGEFYLCISRLLPYKNVGAIIEAFATLDLPLIVVGSGPEERRLASIAGSQTLLVKNLSDAQIRWLYARCTALVAASYEDFGLTPIEAAAFGKPSIVLRWGGFLDTLLEGETGVYFDAPDAASIVGAVLQSRSMMWDAERLRRHSATFGEDRFIERLTDEISRIDFQISDARLAAAAQALALAG